MVKNGGSIFDRTHSSKYPHVNNMNSCITKAASSEYDNPEIMEYLLENGVNINDETYYGTPLYLAIINDNILIVITLLNNGADINYCNVNDYTLLHIASINGHLDIIRMLLSRGAKYSKTIYGKTPIDMAFKNKNSHKIKELFDIWPILMIIIIFTEKSIFYQLDFNNICDLYEYIGLSD